MSQPTQRCPVRDFLERGVAARRMPAAAWSVACRERVVSRGAIGHAVLEPTVEPSSDDTPFDLASLTKPLCTALLLVLAEADGSLALDAPISEFVEEMGGSAFADASLIELAVHAARLPAWRPLYLAGSDASSFAAQIARERPAVDDGESLYSDLGYVLLGIAIERTAGATLDTLFAQRVARPLGLARLGFAAPGVRFADAAATERGNRYERVLAGRAGRAFGWRRSVIRGEVHDGNAFALGGVAGHAGLFGPIAEVAALARELLDPHVLPLGGKARVRLFEPYRAGTSRTVGWILARGARAAAGILPDSAPGHTGFTGTSIWLDPDAGRSFVLLTNRVHPEVRGGGFDPVRRGFHRVAAAVARSASGEQPLQ
ncbi:MAG TPA: serine hydrolase domain-containing protein [Candidatus Polarisedimenticolaceae bacterium]|nr:serine hydrolase domain-containing protein [Candidatus Polarisedimenticolaceae bacterium]